MFNSAGNSSVQSKLRFSVPKTFSACTPPPLPLNWLLHCLTPTHLARHSSALLSSWEAFPDPNPPGMDWHRGLLWFPIATQQIVTDFKAENNTHVSDHSFPRPEVQAWGDIVLWLGATQSCRQAVNQLCPHLESLAEWDPCPSSLSLLTEIISSIVSVPPPTSLTSERA